MSENQDLEQQSADSGGWRSNGRSVLRNLDQTIDMPRVILQDVEPSTVEPLERPDSAEIPERDADSRYQVQGEIARGGMGAIHKGRDTDLGRDLAIKVLLSEHKDRAHSRGLYVQCLRSTGPRWMKSARATA